MKDIVIITAVFPPEPVVSAQLSYDIAHLLASEQYNVTVIHPRASRPLGFKFLKELSGCYSFKVVVANSYVNPISTLLGRMYESYSFGKFCVQYIREHKNEISVLYVNSWPILSQFLIICEAKRWHIPSILHVQDIYPESYSNKLPGLLGKALNLLLMPIDQYILKSASKVIAISANMKTYLMQNRKVSDNKFRIVENWQDESVFLKFEGMHTDNKIQTKDLLTFMYLGNNGPVANIEYTISCFVKANMPNTRLVIAGNGSKKQECILLSSKYTQHRIEFWEVPDGMVPKIQAQADFLLLPLRKGAGMSSIPSKLPAYMFSKKPIIGSLDTDSETAKAIINANCGIVVEPDDELSFIKAYKLASEWTITEKEEKGNNGFIYAIKRFSRCKNLPLVTGLIKEYAKD